MSTSAENLTPRKPAQLVRDAVEQTDTTTEAADLLERWAKQMPSLKAYLLDPWLEKACYQAVSGVHRQNRSVIWTAPNYAKGGNGKRVIAHGKSLLDFPLPGGMLLRDSKQKDLEAAAKLYEQRAQDESAKAAWLRRIAEKVGRKKVESVFSAEQLQALREMN